MALFLNESLTGFDTETISIEEAYDGLLEASYEMHELTESLLQADFIIHENTKMLNEKDQLLREENFLVKAAVAVKKFLISVKDKVVGFLKKLAEVAKNAWNRLVGKVEKEEKKQIMIPAGSIALITAIIGYATAAKEAATSERNAAANNSTIMQMQKMKDTVAKLKGMFKDKTIKREPTAIERVKGIFTLNMDLSAQAEKIKALLGKKEAAISNTEPTKESIENGKTQGKLSTIYASASGSVNDLMNALSNSVISKIIL